MGYTVKERARITAGIDIEICRLADAKKYFKANDLKKAFDLLATSASNLRTIASD